MPINPDIETALLDISRQAFRDEQACVHELLEHTAVFQEQGQAILERAEHYVEDIRSEDHLSGVEGFIHQYGLDNKEGVAIMCLAESLLRIPDSTTADALIHDKFKEADWEAHMQDEASLFVNAPTWGLMLTGGVVNLGDMTRDPIGKTLGKLASKLGEPVIRTALKHAMTILGKQFVLGTTIESALKKAEKLADQGYIFSFDMLGEGARSMEQADKFFEAYYHAITVLGQQNDPAKPLAEQSGISIKLSALHPRYEALQRERVMQELLLRVKELLQHAQKNHMIVSIDAEESWRLDLSLELYHTLLTDPLFKDYNGIGFVLQAYQKRAMPVLKFLVEQARLHQKIIPLRLVKGAYWDTEIKYAQEQGLEGYPVFTRKSHTDVSYLACAKYILEQGEIFYPQFATHNALTVASILENAGDRPFEFQRLYGMGEDFYDQQVKKRPVRIYAPVGSHKELLPYLIRRLLENGANSSFVNLVVDKEEPIGYLLTSPVGKAIAHDGLPREDIPLPQNIYTDRLNSKGLDRGNYAHITYLQGVIDRNKEATWAVQEKATPEDVSQAVKKAAESFPKWNGQPMNERADMADAIAQAIVDNRDELLGLLVYEAKKTVMDALMEIREAEDFCRYYAACARELAMPHSLPGPTGETNQLSYEGKGVFACISPWNFPLSIFTGQVVAALLAGNSVIAKPAEQTPCIAQFMVKLMHQAGVPKEVLQLVIGGGKIGSMLVEQDGVDGVAFTGSTATARYIQAALAEREQTPIATMIAETGGQNAMIVDSTALLEQVVDDIVHSAFGCAGQRCSALRVAYIQEDIYLQLTALLAGAMQELKVGSAASLATDVGEIIDDEAQKVLQTHCKQIVAQTVGMATLSEKEGIFTVPHAFAIENIDILEQEVFGPILHIISFASDQLDNVIRAINSTGYGLTCGIHSRIEERIAYITSHIRAGNIYINRGMTGAMVGTQPFGGMGLSGTGPKAGGPNYLKRFMVEKTCTNNVTAIGGNLVLLQQK